MLMMGEQELIYEIQRRVDAGHNISLGNNKGLVFKNELGQYIIRINNNGDYSNHCFLSEDGRTISLYDFKDQTTRERLAVSLL